MRIGDIEIIPAVMEGEDLRRPRAHLRIGDMIATRTLEGKFHPLLVRNEDQIETFYRAVGIDYWTRDVVWT